MPAERDEKGQLYIDPAQLAQLFGNRFKPLPNADHAQRTDAIATPTSNPATSLATDTLPSLQAELERMKERLAEETRRREQAENLVDWFQSLAEHLTMQNTRLLTQTKPHANWLAWLFRR